MSDISKDFDKKNEAYSIKELGKFLDKSFKSIGNMFNEITKDIRDRQDNIMAMEFIKVIGDMLVNNGVAVKITEYDDFIHVKNTISEKYGVFIEGLDFNEHDKKFKYEIGELKAKLSNKNADYKTVSSLLSQYQMENESLKQRIAELERKETEKPRYVHKVIVAKEIGGQTYVRLEDFMSVVNDLQAEIGI